MSPCLLLGMAPGICCGGTLGSRHSGCRPAGESMLSPGPGGEELEEGQVHGLRGASATSSRPASSADGDMEPRTLCFYFKANGRAFAQELPRPSPRRFSCPPHLFPPGPEAWACGLGRTESFIAIQGAGAQGVFVQSRLEVFPPGKGISGVTRGTACFVLGVPMAGLFMLRPECVVDVGWWDGAWLCPALSKGPTGRVSCLGKANILLVLTVKQPLDLF